MAYHHAPEEIINILLILIDKENEEGNHIFIIRKVEHCWDDRLAAALLSKLKNAVNRLKELTPIDCVYLYGSYAWGHPKPYSDVDVVVVSPAFGRNIVAETVMLMEALKTETLSWNRGLLA